MIDGTSIRILERTGWDREKKGIQMVWGLFCKGCKTGKLSRNLCAAWRHGLCRQAPSQQYYFCVVARDSEDVGDFLGSGWRVNEIGNVKWWMRNVLVRGLSWGGRICWQALGNCNGKLETNLVMVMSELWIGRVRNINIR